MRDFEKFVQWCRERNIKDERQQALYILVHETRTTPSTDDPTQWEAAYLEMMYETCLQELPEVWRDDVRKILISAWN